MRAEGASYRQIARALSVGTTAVKRWTETPAQAEVRRQGGRLYRKLHPERHAAAERRMRAARACFPRE